VRWSYIRTLPIPDPAAGDTMFFFCIKLQKTGPAKQLTNPLGNGRGSAPSSLQDENIIEIQWLAGPQHRMRRT
jgi:hypothetical protein